MGVEERWTRYFPPEALAPYLPPRGLDWKLMIEDVKDYDDAVELLKYAKKRKV